MKDLPPDSAKSSGKGKIFEIKDVNGKKKQPYVPAVVKLKQSEIQANLAESINGDPKSSLPSFPHVLGALSPEKGARVPILVAKDHVIEVVRLEFVRDEIIAYCKDTLRGYPEYLTTHQQAMEAAKFWLSTARVLPDTYIKMVRWADEAGFTYRRLPWKMGEPEWTPTKRPAPTWELLLSRMTNNQAFIDWIGSLFFDNSSLQSYLWLHGGGGDGKGSISRFLSDVFGRAYRSKQPPGKFGDKFWTHGILGARLVVFPDCNDAQFVTSGLFKSLTGGDPVELEAKGSMSFTARLNAKYLVISQARPALSSERADLRRIVYCEIDKCPEIDPEFEAKLWAEGGDFLSTCVRQYEAKYPTHGAIMADMEAVMDIVETREEVYQQAFDRWFLVDPEGYVAPGTLQDCLRQEWPKARAPQLAFLDWLERVKGIRKKQHRVQDDVRQKRYDGIRLRRSPGSHHEVTMRENAD